MKSANEKWLSIPQKIRKKLISNVWCGKCSDAVTIVGYVIEGHDFGIVLKGKCKTCGHDIARSIENEN